MNDRDRLTLSALVIVVPEADPVIGAWRAELDPSATLGVPAHITLLYPFVPPSDIDDGTLLRVERVVGTFSSFLFRLEAVRWFGDSVVWLHPVPHEPFVELTRSLLDEFPEYPRYGGAVTDEVTPHLTIGDGAPVDAMQAAGSRVAADLPIAAQANEVALLWGSSDAGSWRVVRRFPLKGE